MMSPKGLSPKLLDELRDTLLACGPFDTYSTLKTVFVDQRIRQWRDDMAFAPTSRGLVDMLIASLYEKADAAGQNGLLLFLRVLYDRTEVNDGRKQRLADLVRRVETELGSSTNHDRTSQAPSEKERTAPSPPNHATTTQPGQGETMPPQLAPSRPAAYEKPKYPEPSQRLKNLGFQRDPFAWPEAESIEPSEELEEFFVAPPRFDEYILDLDRSAVLLAPRGGGKTACRLRLSTHLNQLQSDALSGISLPGQPAPFVVIYDDFEALLPALPGVKTSHHTAPLLHAVAEATFRFLQNYSDHFLALSEHRQQRWGQFLQAHLSPDRSLEERLDRLGNQALAASLEGVSPAPTSTPISLRRRLTTFRDTLQQDFGLDHVYILIDGVDGYTETKSLTDPAGLLSPLLDGLSLLSLNGIIWKFFLPELLADTVRASAALETGRCHVLPINWDKDSLITLLKSRLQWASAGQIRELSQICESELDVSEELVQMALSHFLGPPRALVHMARDLFASTPDGSTPDGPLSVVEWQRYFAAQRLENMQTHIARERNLLNQYEEQLTYADDSRQIGRIVAEINRQKRALAGYQQEARDLQAKLPAAASQGAGAAQQGLADIAAQLNALSQQLQGMEQRLADGQEVIRRDLAGQHAAILAHIDAAHRQTLQTIVAHLDTGQLALVELLLDAADRQEIAQWEAQNLALLTQQALVDLHHLRQGQPDAGQWQSLLAALEQGTTWQQKLKLTIPIIPGLLEFESEANIDVMGVLNASWRHLLARLRGE